jgi:tRNA threonylcarbamoyladenosine biosynthesis protein TsaE
MVTFISKSPEETLALGEQLGRQAQTGWVIGLTGDLGAGKTQWVKGLARGLGIASKVSSPTFSLVNPYSGGRLPLFHLDLYRLETPQQAFAAGLDDYFFDPPGVTVVEWIENRFPEIQHLEKDTNIPSPPPHLPKGFRHVRIESLNELERRISYENFGS